MRIQKAEGREIVEISLEEFKQQVRQGEIGPKTRVQDKILTDNEWQTADNFKIFHRNSPVSYPYGEHLLKRIENEKLKEAQARRISRRNQEYLTGDIIEENYLLEPLSEITRPSKIQGASRLIIIEESEFSLEKIITLTHREDGVEVDIVRGKTQLWRGLPQRGRKTTPHGL